MFHLAMVLVLKSSNKHGEFVVLPQCLLEYFESLFQLPLFLHDGRLHQQKHRALANPEAKAEGLFEATGGRPIPPLP